MLISPRGRPLPQSLRSFWPAAGIESSGSNHFEITKEITEFCPSGFTQSSSMAHARNGCSQSSRFLPQARRIIGYGDENAVWVQLKPCYAHAQGCTQAFLPPVIVAFPNFSALCGRKTFYPFSSVDEKHLMRFQSETSGDLRSLWSRSNLYASQSKFFTV